MGVQVPRLRHPLAQWRQTVGPVSRGAAGRGRIAETPVRELESPTDRLPDRDRLFADGARRDRRFGSRSPACTNEVVAGTIKIVSTSILGLTVGCAQCHPHRYDPISQVDYYRLRAVFDPALDCRHWRSPGQRLVSLWTDADRHKAAAVQPSWVPSRKSTWPNSTRLSLPSSTVRSPNSPRTFSPRRVGTRNSGGQAKRRAKGAPQAIPVLERQSRLGLSLHQRPADGIQ